MAAIVCINLMIGSCMTHRFRSLNIVSSSTVSAGLCALVLLACGGSGGGDGGSASPGVPPAASTPAFSTIALLAGSVGGAGHIDGTGTAARLTAPAGMALDSAGNVFVVDTQNYTVRKISTAGVITTVAGVAGVRGTQDGDAAVARLHLPTAITVDPNGFLFIVDGAAIRRITPAGAVATLAGVADMPGATDGTGSAARFDSPSGITADASGVLYVADHNAMIRKVTSAGVVTTVAGKAYDYAVVDGAAGTARFFTPQGIAVDNAGNIFVSDANASRANAIRKIAPSGVVSTLAGNAGPGGWSDGTGTAATFDAPAGVAVDNAGNVYVADSGNQVIRRINIAGGVTTIAGKVDESGVVDGAAANARFYHPFGIAADLNGNVFIGDTGNHTIRKLTATGVVTTVAGAAAGGGAQDGLGAAAGMLLPQHVAVDSTGNTYVADVGNATVRKITPAGAVTTLAGSPGMFGSADGTGSAARFFTLTGLTVDNVGNVYVTDVRNCVSLCAPPLSTLNTIRKITPAGVVTTLAGGDGRGEPQFSDGTGSAARFYLPSGLTSDSDGNVYVADCGNGALRKITPAGIVTTPVRSGVCRANALTNLVSPTPPSGLARDSAGNFYLGDAGANVIRKISAVGAVSIVAGGESAPGAVDGTGTAARFNTPRAIAIDTAGNLYVADTTNNAIRLVTPAGAVTTIVGKSGVDGVTLGNLPGNLSAPQGIAVDSRGTLVVSTKNGVVRVQ